MRGLNDHAWGLSQASWAQLNWLTDAWLWAYPQATIAVQNPGGLRQSLPAGPITKADIFGLMPFDNQIYEVQVSGAELVENFQIEVNRGVHLAVAGIRYHIKSDGSVEIFLDTGEPLDLQAEYRVLINSFMYNGGGELIFGVQDPQPDDLGVNYRQPLIDWCLANPSSAASPVELHIDPQSRVTIE